MSPTVHPDPDDADLPESGTTGPWATWSAPTRPGPAGRGRSRQTGRAERGRRRRDRKVDVPEIATRRSSGSASPWRDLRMVLGVVLLAASALLGMRVVASGPAADTIWVVDRDLPRGTVLAEGDLRQESVVRSASVAGLSIDEPALGQVLRSDVHRDQVLTAADIAVDAGSPPTRLISVPVDAMSLPPLHRGDRVDLWSVPEADSPLATATLVLADVVVMSVVAEESAGVSGEVPVVLAVPVDVTPIVLQAVRDGALALVQVPVGVNVSTPTPPTTGARP